MQILMTNNTNKVLEAVIMPPGSSAPVNVNPGECITVGKDSNKYLSHYMKMVRRGFTMSKTSDDAIAPGPEDHAEEPVTTTEETVREEIPQEPETESSPSNSSEEVEDNKAEEPVVSTVTEEDAEQPKKRRTRRKSSPSEQESGDISE